MESKDVKAILESPLPDTYTPTQGKYDPEKYIKRLLKTTLPVSEQSTIKTELKWHFVLEKHAAEVAKPKQSRVKRKGLTRKDRKQFGLLKIPKKGWNYSSLGNLRNMWVCYMKENLDLMEKAPKCQEPEWANFSLILAKSEFVGAELTVIRSKNPCNVDLKGTVVLETKETFQIVTPRDQLKTLVKKESVFTFEVNGMKFTFFGKHLVTRPADRSTKKIKSFMIPDL